MTTVHARPEKLRCSACGLTASCDCGAEYIPASAYARMALRRNPEKSNVALAVEAGVSSETVRRLRQAGGDANASPDAGSTFVEPDAKVIGLDGKSYPAQRNKKDPPAALPTKEQPEVKRFVKALEKLSYAQRCYLWRYVLPQYDPRGLQDDYINERIKEARHVE